MWARICTREVQAGIERLLEAERAVRDRRPDAVDRWVDALHDLIVKVHGLGVRHERQLMALLLSREGWSHAKIGKLYGVDAATAGRWAKKGLEGVQVIAGAMDEAESDGGRLSP